MPDPRVSALCREFGIEIIPPHKYPEIGQTRATGSIERIIRKYGEDHTRWVLRTLAETANSKALLDETGIWAASDLVLAYWTELQDDPEAWFQVWDAAPVGLRQWEIQRRLAGIVNQRAALAGAINKHLYERFDQSQPDLLERAGV